jgi:16S rRNA processing protein RimM
MGESAYLIVGKIVGTHGIRGDLKVLSYADSLDVFVPGKELVFSRGNKSAGRFTVTSCRPHKNVILLAIDGITSIETANAWVGFEVCTEKASLPPPEEGAYYWYQIIGMKVLTTDDVLLGRVEAIFPTGSNDVYVVRDGKKEVLIPAIDSVVLHIDVNEKVMTVDLPEGLED